MLDNSIKLRSMYDCKDVVDVALFTGNLPYFIKPCLVKPFLPFYLERFKISKVFFRVRIPLEDERKLFGKKKI